MDCETYVSNQPEGRESFIFEKVRSRDPRLDVDPTFSKSSNTPLRGTGDTLSFVNPISG